MSRAHKIPEETTRICAEPDCKKEFSYNPAKRIYTRCDDCTAKANRKRASSRYYNVTKPRYHSDNEFRLRTLARLKADPESYLRKHGIEV